MPIHHRNISIVNFAWGQKVVPAGCLPAADRLELRHDLTSGHNEQKDLNDQRLPQLMRHCAEPAMCNIADR